jgi:hypothetical protein
MLFPEYTRSRIPTDIAVRSGLVSRSQTYTITTNAAGNAIFTLFPQFMCWSQWASLLNGADLNVDNGTQTAVPTQQFPGPMSTLTSVVSWRLTGLAIEMEPITSSLNNQGRVICTMNNGNTLYISSQAPNGITTARDCEYVTYSSVAGSIGHRLVYHNTSIAEDQFIPYSTSPEPDYIEIIV